MLLVPWLTLMPFTCRPTRVAIMPATNSVKVYEWLFSLGETFQSGGACSGPRAVKSLPPQWLTNHPNTLQLCPAPLPFPVCFWWWPLDTWPESLGASLTGVPSPSRWGCGLGPSGTCVSLPKCGSPSGASPRAVFLRTKDGQAPLLPERQAISCCLTRGVAWRDSQPVRDRSCSIYNILDVSTHGDSFPN